MASSKMKELSSEKLKELKEQVYKSLTYDRHALLVKFPFAGNITMRMNLIPCRDKRVLTACTDGKSIWFNISFYNKLKPNERVFVLAHEVWHCVMMHLVRQHNRDSELFNIATDMEVNYLLNQQNNGASTVKLVPPKHLLFPPKQLEGKSAETIYEWLLKSSKGNKGALNKILQQCSNGGDGSNGSETGELEGQFDNHSFEGSSNCNADNNESGDDKVYDEYGEVGYDKDFKPSIPDDFADQMRETIIAEAQRCERTQGHMPAGLDGFLEEIMTPQIRWTEVLAQFVTQCYNGKRQWLPPSRRHVHEGIYLQSLRDQRIKVTVAIDTSGSCIGDLPKFFSELVGLLTSFGNYELNLIQCDADVSSFETYDESNPFPVDDIKNFKWSGGGGTSFVPAFDYVRDNAIEQDCFIFFTDSYGDAPDMPPPYPVLWILTEDGQEDFCDWGMKLKFKGDKDEL